MTEQKERLKKLYALALRGVGGEKEQAQAILDKLLKKYAMTLDDLDDEVIQEYDLEYHGKEQDRILMQTAYKVTDDKNAFNHLQYNHSGRACRTRLRVRCTAAQKAEIEFLFSFYVRLWEKEKEALLQAFFQKHRIFGNLKDGESGAELSPEELLKLELMMKGLSDLTSDDGMKDYGTAEDYVFLLSCDLYRKYRESVPRFNNWWWTLTPWTCNPSHAGSARIVYSSGELYSSGAYNGYGVAPACLFNPKIFE